MTWKFSGKYDHPKSKQEYTYEGIVRRGDGQTVIWDATVKCNDEIRGRPSGIVAVVPPFSASRLDELEFQVRVCVDEAIHNAVNVQL
jgi:hypothetical protein